MLSGTVRITYYSKWWFWGSRHCFSCGESADTTVNFWREEGWPNRRDWFHFWSCVAWDQPHGYDWHGSVNFQCCALSKPFGGYTMCPKYCSPEHSTFSPVYSSGADGKESTCNAGAPGSVPGLERSSEEGNGYPLQYSCLGNSMNRGAWQATVHGVAKSWTRLSEKHFRGSLAGVAFSGVMF